MLHDHGLTIRMPMFITIGEQGNRKKCLWKFADGEIQKESAVKLFFYRDWNYSRLIIWQKLG